MHRRTVLAGLLASGLASPRLRAQPLRKMARIGLLIPAAEPTGASTGASEEEPRSPQRRAALITGLRNLGWVEGKNLVIETRWAGVDPQRQRELAAELAALPVALIVTNGLTAIRAARDGAPGLPIVMINAGDPVGSGFIASLARPGGNLTGTSAAGEEVLVKQLELLTVAAPHVKRVGVLMNRSNAANDFFFASMRSRAARLGLPLERIEVSSPEELDDAVARARGGALVVLADPMFSRERVRIVGLIQRANAPAIFGRREFVAAGGLMSLVSSDAWHWREAASFVDKILRGASPANLPVEQPTAFELSINLKAARARADDPDIAADARGRGDRMNSCRSMAVTWVPLAARVDRRYALAPAPVMSCATAHAQACQGVPRLGVLSYFPAPSALRPDPFETSSLKALRETGYVHAEDVIRETEAGAQRLGLQMQIVRVNGAGGFEAGFATARKQHAQGVVRLAAWPHRARVAAIVLRYRMPSPGESSEEARDGFLLGYGVDLDDLDRHTVTKLDKIVKGARAGELPIERPTKVRLTVNLKNARAIGATIPQSLLLRADEVIQ